MQIGNISAVQTTAGQRGRNRKLGAAALALMLILLLSLPLACASAADVPAPVLSAVTSKYAQRDAGAANRWYAKASGGSGALQYFYRLYKDGAVYREIGWKTESSYALTFTEPGVYKMQVRVKDAAGARSAYAYSPEITVASSAPVLSAVTSKYDKREINTANRWYAKASGGSGALQYFYRLYRNDEVYREFGWKTQDSLAYTITEAGVYKMQVRVKDATGARSDYVLSPKLLVINPNWMMDYVKTVCDDQGIDYEKLIATQEFKDFYASASQIPNEFEVKFNIMLAAGMFPGTYDKGYSL